jgi:lytic murein transglycosylase
MVSIRFRRGLAATTLAALVSFSADVAEAAAPEKVYKANPRNCTNTGSFDRWLDGFRREAERDGISRRVLAATLDGMTLDPSIIRRDRGQGFFSQSFLSFSERLATKNRIDNARRMIKRADKYFDRSDKEFGVPREVLTAFWALESDFGVGMGKLPVLRSLATLAYDCRRGEMFTDELKAALKVIERGDLRPTDMIGSWAGELGQTQFLPSHYLRHARDWDGDGRRDLFKSIPDIIGSSAAFVAHIGWKRGEPWLEEVVVPARLPWQEADLTIQHPRSKWAEWGVTRADGRPLARDGKPASLLLLMGRNGPAFLAHANFRVFTEWNHSLNYATTAAFLATRIAGAGPMRKGNGVVEVLDTGDVQELQRLLARRGHDVGEIDGRLGSKTRPAIKREQLRLGLPADSYPTRELIQRLKGAR